MVILPLEEVVNAQEVNLTMIHYEKRINKKGKD